MKSRILYDKLPKGLLSKDQMQLIKGGILIDCGGSNTTLKVSDHTFNCSDVRYSCGNGATLTPIVKNDISDFINTNLVK